MEGGLGVDGEDRGGDSRAFKLKGTDMKGELKDDYENKGHCRWVFVYINIL